MTFEDYLCQVVWAMTAHPEWRLGQAYFNVLHFIVGSPLADKVRATDLDPFYNDDVIPAFLGYVKEGWV